MDATAPRPVFRRRLRYVDRSIQRWLLIAMVSLEVTLVAASIGFAYWRLIEMIDESMYRMNVVPVGPTMLIFAEEGFWALGLFTIVNVIALMIAAGIWSRHEKRVLQNFSHLIGKSLQLDFSADPDFSSQHEVLTLASAWRERERKRFVFLREQVVKLEAALSAGISSADLRQVLDSLNKLLSPTQPS
ncbi:MAG: hypothetical protein HY847_08290 [Betaproteobacteria bacterium]|nr:hypothetical protein [Betaproteobacteria bacterium]